LTYLDEAISSLIPLPIAGEFTFQEGNPLILIPLKSKVTIHPSEDASPISNTISTTSVSLVKKFLGSLKASRILNANASIKAPLDLPKILVEPCIIACAVKASEIDLKDAYDNIQRLMQVVKGRAFLLLSLAACSLFEDSLACRIGEGFITLEAVPSKLWILLARLRRYSPKISSEHLSQLLVHSLGHLSIEVANAIRTGDTEALLKLINMESFIIQALDPPPPSVQLILANLSKMALAVKPLIPLKRIAALHSQKPSLPPRFKELPLLEV